MTFAQIFERTKYAFDHDEVYELLSGKKNYAYQAPRYPASVPTCDEFVFRDGIYPLYRQQDPAAQNAMLDKLVRAFRKMMHSGDEVDAWWALSLLYGQKLSEVDFRKSPFFVADDLLKELAPVLLGNQEKLKLAHVYEGNGMEDGLWSDVLRYYTLLRRNYNFVLWED